LLNLTDVHAIETLREYLNEMAYEYVGYRMVGCQDWNVFPEESYIREISPKSKCVAPIHRLLFALLRQGLAIEEAVLQRAFRRDVLIAMKSIGLLRPKATGEWSTPDIAIVPIGGLYLAASLPPHYLTAVDRRQPGYIGPESVMLARAVPYRLHGHTALDICSGCGIHGLTCALRGASHVTCLELDRKALELARFNVILNGFSNVVEVRESNLLSALAPTERFSIVLSNPPFMPVSEDVDYPICGAGGADGTRLIRQIFEQLPLHLSHGAQGAMCWHALGDRSGLSVTHSLLDMLNARSDCFARVYTINAMPLSAYVNHILEPNLRQTCPDLSPEGRSASIERWQADLHKRQIPAEFVYDEIMRFWVGKKPDWFDFSEESSISGFSSVNNSNEGHREDSDRISLARRMAVARNE
jgi:Methyltransferase small domain